MLASHEGELDGSRLPAVLRPYEPAEPRRSWAGGRLAPPRRARWPRRSPASRLVAWLLLGAGAPGAALVAAFLVVPCCWSCRSAPVPSPAAVVAGTAYLWLAAYEIVSGKTVLFAP